MCNEGRPNYRAVVIISAARGGGSDPPARDQSRDVTPNGDTFWSHLGISAFTTGSVQWKVNLAQSFSIVGYVLFF